MPRAVRLVLEALVLALAAWQLFDVGTAVANRIDANFDLEWMEGATLLTGLRFSQGLPFYTEPAPDYIPFIYPPLYAWILGVLSSIFPLGYTLGRGVSVACAVAAMVVLALGARREGARWPMALGAAALFVGCYEEGGTFYDLVRIDSLALALTGSALVLARGESRAAAVGGGLLLALAFAAKHNMALFGLPILWWRWRTFGRRDAIVFVAASAGPALVFTLALQAYTGGLFLTYLLEVPAFHGMVIERALPNLQRGRWEGAPVELVRALPYTTTVAVLSAWLWARTRGGAYWGAVLVTGLVMASLMRGHQGGYLNVLIPMLWLLSFAPIVVEQGVGAHPRVAGSRFAPWLPVVATALLAAQLWEGRGNLVRFLPTAADRRAAAALVEELRTLPGPVLMPHGPWYPVLAGHAPSFALIALWDVDKKGGPLLRESRVVDRAIREGHWATIVTPDEKLGHGLKDHYTRARKLKAPQFPTRTGWGVRFRWVWQPGAPAVTGAAPEAGEAADPGGEPGAGEAP